MAADSVNLSASIRQNLLALQSTNALFERTSNRLSTGLKINSALDGASSFFTARSLNNRASDLTGLKDGMGQAIQTLKAADKGITSLTKLVEQAKSLADQAKEAATNVTKISGAAATSTVTAGDTIVNAFGAVATTTFTITVAVTGGSSLSIAMTTTMTITDLASQIQAADSALTATYNSTTRKIDITAAAGIIVTIGGNGTDDSTILTAGNNGATTFGATGSGSTVASLETDFEKVMAEINKLVTDTGYKGVNLLNGNDLTVTTNESSSTIVVTSATLNTAGLNYTAATVDWTVSANIDTSITESKSALSTLRSQASTFSTDLSMIQTREDFTNNMIQTLGAGAGLLIDANLEEESANLLALQTRQALGTSALTFANQAQKSVLQLFR